jgi:hypothetical protein
MNTKIFKINDLEQYCKALIQFSSDTINPNNVEQNIDEYISLGQVISLVKSKSKLKKGKTYISEKNHDKLLDIVTDMIYGAGLAKLAGQNIIECAWDSEKNEMIFWKD